ncbi:multiple cyclophane-containing RiPP AmcA [Micromonospora sp. NPDC049089]|uniref:multiple cyclophane-containing RiPP AmcA n=1 Tax=unclassified Micromonospora TaxID=2617518 RepID=UPI00340DD994
MTVYVSRYAVAGELATDRAAVVPAAVGPGSAERPLLTHVWRVLFEQQARKPLPMSTDGTGADEQHRPVPAEHLPLRPLWLCRR